MSDNIISSVFSTVKWFAPTVDNARKDAVHEEEGMAQEQEMVAGIAGIGTDVPSIAPSEMIGGCLVSVTAPGLRMPKDLRDVITKSPRVKNLNEDPDNVGYAVVSGFKHGCFFYVNTDRQYVGGSIGGVSPFAWLDKHNTFLSAVISTKRYGYNPNNSVPSLSDETPDIDAQASHFLLYLGGSNVRIGAEYAKHIALIDDVRAGDSEEWKARFEVLDIEKIFKADTDFSLGIGASASNKGEYAVYADFGVFKLTAIGDKDSRFGLETLVGGGSTF